MLIVDILSFRSCLKILFNFNYKDEYQKNIYYLSSGKLFFDHLFINILKLKGLELISIRSLNGRKEFYSSYPDVIKLLNKFQDKYILPAVSKEVEKTSQMFTEYEKKRIRSHLLYIESELLYRSIEILHLLDSKNLEIPSKDQCLIILLSTNWDNELKAFFAEYGYKKISFYKNRLTLKINVYSGYISDMILSRGLYNLYYTYSPHSLIVRFGTEIINTIRFFFIRLFKGQNIRLGKFDIGAVVPGYDRTERFNDLFWKKSKFMEKKRILAILYGRFDKDAYDKFGYLADRWISLKPEDINSRIYSVYNWLGRGYITCLFYNLFRLCSFTLKCRLRFYYFLRIAHLMIEVCKMESLFRLTDIKLFYSSVEQRFLTGLAGALAIRKIGGVTLGSTWSIYSLPDFRICRNYLDVWFIWGEHHAESLCKSGEISQAMVICGYPGDFAIDEYIERASTLRKKWTEETPQTRIICLYDNIISYDGTFNFTDIKNLLEQILHYLDEEEKTLFVIKTKRKEIFLDYPISVKDKIKDLERKNRLKWAYEVADLSPGIAADIVFGLGLATLPSLLGSLGKRVILYDRHNIAKTALFSGNNGVKIINNLNGFKEIVCGYLKQSKTNHNIPLQYLKEAKSNRIVAFVDGLAYERIAFYISTLLYFLKRGYEPDKAIKLASSSYRRRWGDKTIITLTE